MTAKLNTVIQIFYEEQKFNYCLVPLLHAFSYYVFQHSKILRGERLHLVARFLLRVADSTPQGTSDQEKDRFPKLRLLRSSHVRAQFCQYTCNPPTEPRSKKPNQKDTKQFMHKSTMETAKNMNLYPPWKERLFVSFKLRSKKHVAIKKKCFFIISKKVEKKIWYLGFSLLYIYWFLLLLFYC